MKLYKNILFIIAGLILIFGVMSCDKIEVGDAFLERPPSIDYTIDSVFTTARRAREMLWSAYATLPYNVVSFSAMNVDRLYGGAMQNNQIYNLTDISTETRSGNIVQNYYAGTFYFSADMGNFATNAHWKGFFYAWTFINNIHKVTDMSQAEKDQLKAEAKMIIALHYENLFRYYGGVPWVGKAYGAEDDLVLERLTVMQTVDSVTRLINEAIPHLPTEVADIANWKGRFDKAQAYGLKTRFLLHAASPLFNSDQPYMEGEASEKKLVWTGGYKPELWERARDAAKNCIDIIEASAYYGMEQPASQDSASYRAAFRAGYLDRGSGETLISTRKDYHNTVDWNTAIRFSMYQMWRAGPAPTHNYAQMFPDKDGMPLSKSSLHDPLDPYRNRDPRFYETLFSSISMRTQARRVEFWEAGRESWNRSPNSQLGYMQYKWVLTNHDIERIPKHWPYIRVPEIYLSYAEALTEVNNGPTAEAFEYVNRVRHRVGLGDIQDAMDNPNDKQEFIDALLTERVLEHGFEHIRWFDITRRKRQDIFQQNLYGVRVIRNEDASLSYNEFLLWDLYPEAKRSWIDDWSPKWYLWPINSAEMRRGYGLVQNPGWEYLD